MASDRLLKQLIWLYFWLVIFEGALRKWVLPGLATPLLLVRDPLVIVALVMGLTSGKLKFNGYLMTATVLAVMAPLMAVTLGHGNFIVAAFGWRTNFLHLPFIFLIGRVFTGEDVKKMGRWFLILSVPMVILMAAQFYSPQGSLVNIGVGGEGDAGFSGALGYRRPPGTFSFSNGLGLFFPLVAAFALAEIMQPQKSSKSFALAAGLATLAALPISISRSMVLGVALVGLGAVLALVRSGRSIRRLINTAAMLVILGLLSSFIPGMEKPREAFMSRWDASTTDRGGFQEAIVGRVINDLTAGLLDPQEKWITGVGLGMGTNAGAKLLTGTQTFLVSEAEWGRLTGEMGMPLGLLFILVRVVLTISLFRSAWKAARRGETLALPLWFATAIHLMQGQWGQPTALGFSTLGAGLLMAMVKKQPVKKLPPPPSDSHSAYAVPALALPTPSAAATVSPFSTTP